MIPSRGEQYVFACHRWLATDEEDHQLEVELEPSYKDDLEKSKIFTYSNTKTQISCVVNAQLISALFSLHR